jgi:hypothetical protein
MIAAGRKGVGVSGFNSRFALYNPGQDRGIEGEGHVDGRLTAAGL